MIPFVRWKEKCWKANDVFIDKIEEKKYQELNIFYFVKNIKLRNLS